MRHKINKHKEVEPDVFRRIEKENIDYGELISSLRLEPEEEEKLRRDLGLIEKRSGWILVGYLTLTLFFLLLSMFILINLIDLYKAQ